MEGGWDLQGFTLFSFKLKNNMAYVNFWKGLAADYVAETHGEGIYQCTDTGDTYIFGVKNSGKGGGNVDFSGYPFISEVSTEEEAIKILAQKINEYHPLQVTFTVNPTPSDATVTINGSIQNSVKVNFGSTVTWKVERTGYQTKEGSQVVNSDSTIDVSLEIQQYTLTVNPTPSDATVILDDETRKSVTVNYGTSVSWQVSKDGYITQSGTHQVVANHTLSITLEAESTIPTSLPSGLTIVDGSGKVHTSYSTWNSGLGLTGIGVNSDGHQFIFGVATSLTNSHVDDNSINTCKYWSDYLYGTDVYGLTNYTTSSQAEQDFNSKSNTDAIIAAIGSNGETDNAARVCRNYSAGVIEKGQWDLPALGILKIINNLRSSIQTLMSNIGKSYWNNMLTSYWAWSSTEYSSSTSWVYDFSYQTSGSGNKDNYTFVIPVFTIV